MTPEQVCMICLIVVSMSAVVILGREIVILKNRLDEKTASADAYDRAACKHNARANKAEQKYYDLLLTAKGLSEMVIRLVEIIEAQEAKLGKKTNRKRGPDGRFAKANAVAKD